MQEVEGPTPFSSTSRMHKRSVDPQRASRDQPAVGAVPVPAFGTVAQAVEQPACNRSTRVRFSPAPLRSVVAQSVVHSPGTRATRVRVPSTDLCGCRLMAGPWISIPPMGVRFALPAPGSPATWLRKEWFHKRTAPTRSSPSGRARRCHRRYGSPILPGRTRGEDQGFWDAVCKTVEEGSSPSLASDAPVVQRKGAGLLNPSMQVRILPGAQYRVERRPIGARDRKGAPMFPSSSWPRTPGSHPGNRGSDSRREH